MGVLNKLKHFVPLNAKVIIYNSLINSASIKLLYSCMATDVKE